MQDYKMLAIRYLCRNRKRTVVTILGVSIAVMVLFAILNMGESALLHYRENIREENDYEIVLFTDEREQIGHIIADPRVKGARIGSYLYRWYDDASGNMKDKTYTNALYINTSNPYKMRSLLEGLKSDYGVEGDYNNDLARTYFGGGSANVIYIGALFLLLVSFIFAIFGVGIIRNSIQLSALEQIKDYGSMRCIGASKRQLKSFIYIEGAVLEIAGIILGVLAGTVVSVIIGHIVKFSAGFHFIPVAFIAVAFLGDLYFAMKENCKLVANMTPISAVRGEYRIRKEKIKIRKSRVFGKLFGVEGDYAYKNIMRSPGRFFKTIFSIGIGIAALMAGGTVAESIGSSIKAAADKYKYYQLYYQINGSYDTDPERIKASLPPMKNMSELAQKSGIADVKRIYAYTAYMSDDSFAEHFTDEYLGTTMGYGEREFYDNVTNREGLVKEWGEEIRQSLIPVVKQAACYGYAKEDIDRYKDVLVDGTLDVSDHGIILVNGGRCEKLPDDSVTLGNEYVDVTYTDYQVGEEIKFVDIVRLKQMAVPRLEQAKAELDENWDEILKGIKEEEEERKQYFGNVEEETDKDRYNEKWYEIKKKINNECFGELLQEGSTVTYTIEGIVSEDVNHEGNDPRFVMPLSNYFALTGTDESQINGIQYHVEKYPLGGLTDYYFIGDGNYDDSLLDFDYSMYVLEMDYINMAKYGLLAGAVFVLFIVSMSVANIINTNASNLHLRRREFAQLRVIGVSKDRLIKMVTLEGVITAIVANVAGVVVGGGIGYLLFWFIHMWTGIPYRFPFVFLLLGVFLSLLLLVGSIYFPIRGMWQDMAGDLVESGE